MKVPLNFRSHLLLDRDDPKTEKLTSGYTVYFRDVPIFEILSEPYVTRYPELDLGSVMLHAAVHADDGHEVVVV